MDADASTRLENLVIGGIDKPCVVIGRPRMVCRDVGLFNSFQSASGPVQPQPHVGKLAERQHEVRQEIESIPDENKSELEWLALLKRDCLVWGARKTNGRGMSWFFDNRSEPDGGEGSKTALYGQVAASGQNFASL